MASSVRTLRATLLAAVLLPIFFASARAHAKFLIRYEDIVSMGSLPNPLLGASSECSPSIGARQLAVCDPSALLSSRSLLRIDRELQRIYKMKNGYVAAPCPNSRIRTGYLVMIAIVRRMRRPLGMTPEDAALAFARDLYSRWNVGGTCGAGVLLFVSLEDRRYNIYRGPLAETVLIQPRLDKVKSVLEYYFKQDNTYLALLNGAIKIGQELAEGTQKSKDSPAVAPYTPSVPPKRRIFNAWSIVQLVIICTAGGFLLIACCNGIGGPASKRRKRETRAAAAKLRLIKQEYEAAILPQYIPITCSYCTKSLTPGLAAAATSDDGLAEASAENGKNEVEGEEASLGPVHQFRCGHRLHEMCFAKQLSESNGNENTCPVCGDSPEKAPEPKSLHATREDDLRYRVGRVAREHPEVVTPKVVQDLLAPPPPPRRSSRSYNGYEDPNVEYVRHRTQGPAWGALAAATGLGALAGWGLSGGFGGGSRDGRVDYGSGWANGYGNDDEDEVGNSNNTGGWGGFFGGGNGSGFGGGWGFGGNAGNAGGGGWGSSGNTGNASGGGWGSGGNTENAGGGGWRFGSIGGNAGGGGWGFGSIGGNSGSGGWGFRSSSGGGSWGGSGGGSSGSGGGGW